MSLYEQHYNRSIKKEKASAEALAFSFYSLSF
jgi:hypothetical protein